MAKNDKLLDRLWSFFQGKPSNSETSLSGGNTGTANRRSSYSLRIMGSPSRAICGDVQLSRELIEMKTWSYELRHSLSIISRDCFQQLDGSPGSWEIAIELGDGTKVPPDIVAIGKELASRRFGKDLILGGDRLQRAARESVSLGDGFLELGLEKDESGKLTIAQSQYLPSLNVFAEGDRELISQYRQQIKMYPTDEDIVFHPAKILHFRYEESGGKYGNPAVFQQLEPWRKIKEVASDLEDAARDSAIAPWLHTMPEGADDEFQQTYRQELEGMQRDGIVTNLFLRNGADVRKAVGTTGVLKDLADYWLQLRYQMILPGVPLWNFPGMGKGDGSAKDLAGQPALSYARMIANLRSIIGEQVRWAIALELVCQRGWDFYEANQNMIDIKWGIWSVTGSESAVINQEEDSASPQDAVDGEEQANNRFELISTNGRH